MGKNCLRSKQSSVSSDKRFRDLNSPTFLIFIRFCSNRNQLWAASAQSAADGPIAVIHLVAGGGNLAGGGASALSQPTEIALRTADTPASYSGRRVLTLERNSLSFRAK